MSRGEDRRRGELRSQNATLPYLILGLPRTRRALARLSPNVAVSHHCFLLSPGRRYVATRPRAFSLAHSRTAVAVMTRSLPPCSQLSAPYAKAMGLGAKAAAADRLAALVLSAISVQRAARALIARRRAFRRRQAIAALQALCRGCRARWALSAALESTTKLGLSGDGSRQGRDVAGDINTHGKEGGVDDSLDLNCGHNACKGADTRGANDASREDLSYGASMQVGAVTRRDVPMDPGCPKGFGSPNLAAFLWESREDAYGPDFGTEGGDTETALVTPRSENEPHDCPCVSRPENCARRNGMSGRINGGDDDDDGAVFEVSAVAVAACSEKSHEEGHMGAPQKTTEPVRANHGKGHGGRSPAFGTPLFSRGPSLPRRPLRWVPATVAPEEALRCALECSTLIVNTPSFGSACARRLFSRMGKALPDVSPSLVHPAARPTTAPAATGSTTPTKATSETDRLQPDDERGGRPPQERQRGRNHASAVHVEVAPARMSHTTRQRHQADGIKHVLLLGESPIGDGGLSELSCAVRCGWLPRLTTLVIGGRGCRVGPRGVTALAVALSSPGCSQLRNLSMR